MADYETSKYTIPATAENIIPASAIERDVLTKAEIANNAITVDELADNAVDTAAIVDSNVTGDKVANTTLPVDKLNASGTRDVNTFLSGNNTFEALSIDRLNATGTRDVDTFLSGNNTFETISIPPSAVSEIRHRSLSQSLSAGQGSVTTVPSVTWTYTATGNETVKVTFNYTGLSTGTHNPNLNPAGTMVTSSTSGTELGPSFSFDANDASRTGIFLAQLTSGQTATVTQGSSRIFGGGSSTGFWNMNGTMVVEVITASTF